MNRNTNLLMGAVPRIHGNRSKMDRSKSVRTTLPVGKIVPIYTDMDICPGDTVEMDVSQITRLATSIVPVMDNLIMDVYAFFTPHRLVLNHWPNFWGENDDPWSNGMDYEIPYVKAPEGGWKRGTVADYMTVPTYIEGIYANALGFRAYAKTISDWFRDENLKKACHVYTDDTDRTGSNGSNYVTDPELGGEVVSAAKTADMFTKALPSPQKGPAVAVPIGSKAPVAAGPSTHEYGNAPMNFSELDNDAITGKYNVILNDGNIQYTDETPLGNAYEMKPNNLWANLSAATAATINELRTAFAIQKFYESAARYGTRYIEFIRAVFGTESSDARMQRSEYLGGTRIPINMDAIVQTSATDAVSPQGNASGYSNTLSKDSLFTKSFEEHGTLMVLAVIRVEKRSYQQGLHKMFTRRKWTDYYNPFFANLGEQPIYNENIYAQGESVVDDNGNIIDKQVFGYQESWAEYRYAYNDITGDMRSNSPAGSLDIYHYGDDYSELPKLGATWIDEPSNEIDRTIAVSSMLAHPFISDFYFEVYYTRLMPLFGMPGLIDHV